MQNEKINGLRCILLVDDDEPTNYLHRKAIEQAKIQTYVQTTTSGEEALEYLTLSGRYQTTMTLPQPGIIFLDINMPGMNGWDFLVEYRHLDESQKARIVVVMLTSSINPQEKSRSEEYRDIAAFMRKPLKSESVRQLVDQYFST